eukprot:2682713-Amphidinium_carterae.2
MKPRTRGKRWWNADLTINLRKFVMARLFRSTYHDICHRPTLQPIHNYTDVYIPPAVVLLAANRGLKFVPDLRRVNFHDIHQAGLRMKRSIDIQQFFKDDEYIPKRLKNAQSTWKPPSSALGERAVRLYDQLTENWKFNVKKSNWTYWDKFAFKWLRQHTEILLADADKNLGGTFLTKQWVDKRLRFHLEECSDTIATFNAKLDIGRCTNEANKVLNDAYKEKFIKLAELKYISSFWKRAKVQFGSLRIRPKVHKDPLSSRPIFISSQSWQRGISELLAHYLQPIANNCTYVLSNTEQLQNRLGVFQRDYSQTHGSLRGLVMATMDIENLYPTIDVYDMKAKVCPK